MVIQFFALFHHPIILITSLTLTLRKTFYLILGTQSLLYISAHLTSFFLVSVSWNPLLVNVLRTSNLAAPRSWIFYMHLYHRFVFYPTAKNNDNQLCICGKLWLVCFTRLPLEIAPTAGVCGLFLSFESYVILTLDPPENSAKLCSSISSTAVAVFPPTEMARVTPGIALLNLPVMPFYVLETIL